MSNDKVMIRDVFLILKKYFVPLSIIVVITVGFSITLTAFINKKYKSSFEINVYSKYFQNPLISGIIPGVYNVPEMRFAIDSMVKEAISDAYIDQVGNEYKLYSDTKDLKEIAKERQSLRSRFSYFSTGGQGYKVIFQHSDPFIAKEIADRTLKEVKGHLIQTRINTIEMVKKVMISKLTSFNATLNVNKKGADKALVSKNPDVLRAEVTKINKNLDALTKQYKKSHPKVLRLQEKKATIDSWLLEYGDFESSTEITDASVTMISSKLISEQISSEFYTKYHDFNIALDIEKRSLQSYIAIISSPQLPTAAIWPKKRLFASVGFLLGLVFAFVYAFFKEIVIPNKYERLETEAKLFGAIILGEMPVVDNAKVRQKTESNNLEINKSRY